jgi:hypothetical protein
MCIYKSSCSGLQENSFLEWKKFTHCAAYSLCPVNIVVLATDICPREIVVLDPAILSLLPFSSYLILASRYSSPHSL